MNNSVVIKGNKNGIVVVLDKNIEFDELKNCLIEKFTSASKFFENANMAISFEGRKLSDNEEREILDVIDKETELNIVCVIDNDELRQQYFKNAVDTKIAESCAHSGQFYKGTLRSGQVLESESSIIILGDVNPGGKVIAKGNVVVLGSLKGNIFAGAGGDEDAFVVAIEMDPMQIRIGSVIARCSDSTTKSKLKKSEAKIAYVEDGNIYIEKLEKDVLSDIRV
ncbi:septum site-determining protein MinC [[Clostridium] fimetarium]|uniref:Probable septum site-determining protein MinC n=1 Tax=[Clostridium] fimetarium TaxID=99656 RepID=A0A1I0QJ87_9FIRM|nr:septum site-determining protein MinC [[Clostridium] fimetarium]SEW27089.1 septum site-determining protein MinC [[Clostridium] fimetarium]